jgi:type IV pilus assembly protein PilF
MELAEDKLAEENFRRAIELDRSDSDARNNYGWFLCTRGRHDEGLEQFSAALRNPLYAQPEQAMANAGLCAEKKGDLALAEANLLKSLKLQPDNANTIIKLAGLHFRQGRLMEAQRLLGRHAELAPPTAESLWLGVRLERKLGDRAQEAAYGLQLRKRFPDSKKPGCCWRGNTNEREQRATVCRADSAGAREGAGLHAGRCRHARCG